MPWDEFVDDRQGGLLMAYQGGSGIDAYFGPGKFGDQLTIEVLLANPEDYPHIKEGKINNWFGLPNGWRVEGNGAKIVPVAWTAKNGNPQEAPSKLRADSPAGQLITQMQKIDPDGLTLANGNPYEALYWKKSLAGAKWGPVNVPSRKQDEAGEWKEVPGGKNVPMPVELVFTGSNGHMPDFDVSSLGWDPTTLDLARAAAASAKDYAGFVQAAVPTMPGNPALQAITSKDPGERIFAALKPF